MQSNLASKDGRSSIKKHEKLVTGVLTWSPGEAQALSDHLGVRPIPGSKEGSPVACPETLPAARAIFWNVLRGLRNPRIIAG